MDDLVGGLLVLTLAAVAIAIAIAVAMAMVVAGAGVGASIALVQGSAAFLADFGASLRTRGGSRRAPLPPEPAYELYVLGQLQRDLRHALETGWGALNRFRGSCAVFADRYGEGWTMPLAIGAVIGGFAGTAIAAVAGVLVSIPIVALTLLGTGGAWLLVGALRVAERIRRRVRRASYECPVDHERFPLPVYVCPACGAEHRRLVPGRWGILRRECACRSTSLPTMVLNGRQRVHLSSTMLPVPEGAAFTVRVCVLSFRTHQRHIDRCLELTERAAWRTRGDHLKESRQLARVLERRHFRGDATFVDQRAVQP